MRLRRWCGHTAGVSSRMTATASPPSTTSRCLASRCVLSPYVLSQACIKALSGHPFPRILHVAAQITCYPASKSFRSSSYRLRPKTSRKPPVKMRKPPAKHWVLQHHIIVLQAKALAENNLYLQLFSMCQIYSWCVGSPLGMRRSSRK